MAFVDCFYPKNCTIWVGCGELALNLNQFQLYKKWEIIKKPAFRFHLSILECIILTYCTSTNILVTQAQDKWSEAHCTLKCGRLELLLTSVVKLHIQHKQTFNLCMARYKISTFLNAFILIKTNHIIPGY